MLNDLVVKGFELQISVQPNNADSLCPQVRDLPAEVHPAVPPSAAHQDPHW